MKYPTVFVLGAGASVPYGFQSGYKLLYDFIYNSQNESLNSITKGIQECDYSLDTLKSFRNDLDKSGRMSIDRFLEHRPEYLNFGKTVIAIIILQQESHHYLTNLRSGLEYGNWYQYLGARLFRDVKELHNQTLAILTYNYDRSLEQYMYNSVKASYNLSDDKCLEIINSLCIIHLHGSLGPLPWQKASKCIEYGGALTADNIKSAANNIKIISESPDGDECFTKARTLLHEADNICFLGFGYDDTNMDRLLLTKCKARNLYGSAAGITDVEMSVISDRVAKKYNKHATMDNCQRDVLDYIRNSIVLRWFR